MITACSRKLLYESSAEIGGEDVVKGTTFGTVALLLLLSAYCSHYRQGNADPKCSLNVLSAGEGRGGVGCKVAPLPLVIEICTGGISRPV